MFEENKPLLKCVVANLKIEVIERKPFNLPENRGRGFI
jgi:hypothetical protein